MAPAAVDKCGGDPKKAAAAILEGSGLDPDQYRLGHTKARYPCANEMIVSFVSENFDQTRS